MSVGDSIVAPPSNVQTDDPIAMVENLGPELIEPLAGEPRDREHGRRPSGRGRGQDVQGGLDDHQYGLVDRGRFLPVPIEPLQLGWWER